MLLSYRISTSFGFIVSPLLRGVRNHSWSSELGRVERSTTLLTKIPTAVSRFFRPKSVAVVGATDREGSVGRTVTANLMGGGGKFDIYPINPTRPTVLGLPCYPSLNKLPQTPDLAVIVTPASTVCNVLKQAVQKKVSSVVVISAGFKELGSEGEKLEKELVSIVKNAEHDMRLIGPNCIGIMDANSGLNATFAAGMANKGNLAFISQSGAMCTAVLDWSYDKGIGFSVFASVGSMADVGWGDLIEFLGSDPQTEAILIYMETIGDSRRFMAAAKEVGLSKPIICIKAGKSPEAAQAAASHTGSLAGSYDVFEAAMRRVGVLTVDTIGELFSCAVVLAKQPRPKGDNLLVITNAGGPAVLATDACVRGGAKMAQLSAETIEALNSKLPPSWSRANPLDVLGDAPAKAYSDTLKTVLKTEMLNSDGILVILSPQDVTDPTTTAQHLIPYAKSDKPIYSSWMGGTTVMQGRKLLDAAGIPVFDHPDEAAHTFAKIRSQTRDLEKMYEIPLMEPEYNSQQSRRAQAKSIIDKVRDRGATLLSEAEAKEVLAAYGLPVVETKICKSVEEAEIEAERQGYPVVVKLHSNTITHKSDIGGVFLDIKSKAEVRNAFEEINKSILGKYSKTDFEGVTVQKMVKLKGGCELLLGCKTDSQFGPVIVFGSGGTYVEIFKDTALAIPPLHDQHALSLISSTKIYSALKGSDSKRFVPVNLEALKSLIVRFSEMVVDLEDIEECDINPIIAAGDDIYALDARILLNPIDRPQRKLAIRPYPSQYVTSHIPLGSTGSKITIRPMHAADEPQLRDFHNNLSPATVRKRYLSDVKLEERATRQALVSVCCAAYDDLIPLMAIDEATGAMIGMCRVQRFPNNKRHAEFKVAVRDDWQGKGVGGELAKKAFEIQKNEKIEKLLTISLVDNTKGNQFLEKFGFSLEIAEDENVLYATRLLQ